MVIILWLNNDQFLRKFIDVFIDSFIITDWLFLLCLRILFLQWNWVRKDTICVSINIYTIIYNMDWN